MVMMVFLMVTILDGDPSTGIDNASLLDAEVLTEVDSIAVTHTGVFENGAIWVGGLKDMTYYLFDQDTKTLKIIAKKGPGPDEIGNMPIAPSLIGNHLIFSEAGSGLIKSFDQSGKAKVIGNSVTPVAEFVRPAGGVMYAVNLLPVDHLFEPTLSTHTGSLRMFAQAEGDQWSYIESLLDEDFKDDEKSYLQFASALRLCQGKNGIIYRVPGVASQTIQVLDSSGAIVREFKWPHPFAYHMPKTSADRPGYLRKTHGGRPLGLYVDTDKNGDLYLLLYDVPLWKDDQWHDQLGRYIVKVNEMGTVLATYKTPFSISAFSVSPDGTQFYGTDLEDRSSLIQLSVHK